VIGESTALRRILLHIANLVVIFFILLPVAAVVIGSLQSEKSLQADTRRILPAEYTFDNFTVILTKGEQKGRIFEQITYLPDNIKKFYTAFTNSFLVAISVTLLTLVFGSMSAYTIARLRFRWTLFLLQATIVARFVPVIVLMIPLYIAMRSLGQLNSLTGVIIAETGFLLPYAILILAPYFDAIPAELEEAARIDGCSRLSAFLYVVLPLATPALSACGVIVFIVSWHELLIPLILNARPDFMTLPVVIASLVGDVFVFFNLMMAICLLALAPTVILVALLQKYIVEGLAAGAVKG
jgi:multiple sugar transport system permease protein